jgi:hypothetical protein
MSLNDACRYLGGIPMHGLYDLAALGQITFVRRGAKRTLVLTRSLDAYLEGLPRVVVNLSKRAAAERDLKLYETRIAAEAAAESADNADAA